MPNPVKDKTILLGVTGSIAAYKAVELASKLHQAGAIVDVVLTEAGERFVTPLTFQSVTARKAYTDVDLWGGEGHVTHIGLGRAANLIVIAPATANTIARLAYGFGDNLLTVAVLASNCPVLLAPAMDAGMYSHPATQVNVEILKRRGMHFIGPMLGHLASGLVGPGRMAEPSEIQGHIRWLLGTNGSLNGRKIVVTAGGTREIIDPVRFITNRSSGKQGYAIAQAALDEGAEVTLITTPTNLAPPVGCTLVAVESSADLRQAVLAHCLSADVLIMAAAVSDFRPAHAATEKIKKSSGLSEIQLELTPDILAEVAEQKARSGSPKRLIGFAAESQDLLENARAKLASKHLDLIVANDITA
ncbi:MAG: bifunctional phosphopantothenoylcysteine decarboxylase/phosphopantothenate--cysteine ligase CoaBC, partial [Anaerolineaceae bacterium]|nr:bifunctional phosphopantothenoylcysteine decarboxylase/phosphopantothenate--cysteine ligase CoaBC [Anaerolineaceae bacterium]